MFSAIQIKNTKTVLHFLVREPQIKSAKPPVLILLHGIGSNEEDLFSLADHLPGKYLIISARAPIALGGNGFAWYQADFSTSKPVYNLHQAEESRKTIIRFIEQLKELYVLDEHEIYLCGFSQGAIMSYSVCLTRPDLVRGMAIMSGRLLDETKPMLASGEKLQHTKIFISHGINDNILPVFNARDAVAFLNTQKLQPVYKEYLAGHEINQDMLDDLLLWLK